MHGTTKPSGEERVLPELLEALERVGGTGAGRGAEENNGRIDSLEEGIGKNIQSEGEKLKDKSR